jgi:hypothetical protein
MKTFKEFTNNEFIGFANAGGNPDQYKNFNVTDHGFANAGGKPNKYNEEVLAENLNPKNNYPKVINSKSNTSYMEC